MIMHLSSQCEGLGSHLLDVQRDASAAGAAVSVAQSSRHQSRQGKAREEVVVKATVCQCHRHEIYWFAVGSAGKRELGRIVVLSSLLTV